jgi:hypothetical protein
MRSVCRRVCAQRAHKDRPSRDVLDARRHVLLDELQLGLQVLHRVARVTLRSVTQTERGLSVSGQAA